MTLGLFIPCYIDQLYPNVGRASLALLHALGHEVIIPETPICCGQPLTNSGFGKLAHTCITDFQRSFADFEYIICPSGSCTLHLREEMHACPASKDLRILELCEFLHDIEQVKSLPAHFPHRVGLHASCHGLRGLKLGSCSECMTPAFSKPAHLLSLVQGLELIPLDRKDECCGFGGTFAIFEPDISISMGRDRVHDHLSHGAEFITSADMSCLMHLAGILQREAPQIKVRHIAEILAAGLYSDA